MAIDRIRQIMLERLLAKKTIKPVTQSQLVSHLLEIKGAKALSVLTRTTPKMRKTNNPYLDAIKIADRNVLVNFQYDEGVLRRLAKENKSPDEFQRGSSWHRPMMLEDRFTPLSYHKDDPNHLYLRCMDRGATMTEYMSPTGESIPASAIKPFLQGSDYKNQGLEDPLRFIQYDINNILALTDSGVTYFLRT